MKNLVASFRGIRFHATGFSGRIGRNFASHTIPRSKAKPTYEELAPIPEEFPLEGFLVGDEASFTLKLLIAACRKKGPGRLIHPELGLMNAKCKSMRYREYAERRGAIALSFEFLPVYSEIGQDSPVYELVDTLGKIDQVLASAASTLVEAISIVDLPSYALQTTSQMFDHIGLMLTSTNGLGRVASSISESVASWKNLAQNTRALLRAPKKLVELLDEALNTSEVAERVLGGLPAASSPDDTGTPSSIVRAASNSLAILRYIRTAATCSLARTAVSESGDTSTVLQLTEDLMKDATSSDLERLYQLRVGLWRSRNLPRQSTHLVEDLTPPLVFAYDVLGDITKAEAVRESNAVDDFGLLFGKVAIP